MTLTTPYSATFIVGDGETKTFSYLFEEVSPNFISVMVYNSVTGLISTPTYVIDTDQKQVIFGEDTPAPTADETVCIYRNTPNVQDVAFRTLHGYDAQTLENILSKIVAMIQEIKSNYFSTQVLQGDPWQLDLLSSEDDGATVNIDYTAKKLVKGLHFKITSGNLQVSADGVTYLTLPKSDDVAEFRQYEQTLPDLTVIRKLQYRVGNQWFDAEANAQYTADSAYSLAESVQTTVNAHINNTTNPHQTTVAKLNDVALTDLQANQFLKYDGAKWVNVYSSATATWGGILGNINDQTDLKNALDGKVNIDGTSIMTAPLKFAAGSMRGAVGPYLNGVSFWKMDSQHAITNIANLTDSQFLPVTTNSIDIGRSANKWKDLYLAGKLFVATLNNGADLTVPNKSGTLATTADVELAANSGSQLYSTGVWYAKMYSASTVPTGAQYDGTNYADFSQVDADNNPVIKIYTGASGDWALTDTITPPAEYNGYIWVTSKIWDIAEQTDQQGGQVLWDHTHKTFTPYPHIVKADTLPDQTGNSGKFLTTDGTNASWSDKPLVNTATGSDSLTILGDATSANTALNIGPYSTAEGTYSLAIGPGSGNAHRVRATKTLGIAIGYDALCLALDSIQLGTGQLTTNYKFSVWNHTMLDKTTGKIPIARLGDDTSTTQGNVLTLDSNGAAVWQAPSGGGSAGQSIDAEVVGGVVVNGSEVSNLGTGGGRGHLILPGSFNLDATTFEVGVAFTTSNQSGNIGVIKGVCTNDGSVKYPTGVSMGMTSVGDFIAVVYTDINDPLAPTIMISGGTAVSSTKYYLKLVYDYNDASTPYKLSVSTDGTTYTVIGQSSTNVPPSNPTQYTIGQTGEKLTSVDMSGCYIKRNGIIIWQGMDAPGLPQRAAKGHEVIEFQAPTAQNNYTWYRLYADGWVEQGGRKTQTSTGQESLALPITMADSNYQVLSNVVDDNVGGYVYAVQVKNKTTTDFKTQVCASYQGGIVVSGYSFDWQVSGMAQG